MEMDHGEITLPRKKNVDEGGYSEEQLDADIELQAGQWLDLKSGSKQKRSSKNQGDSQQKKTLHSSQKGNLPNLDKEKIIITLQKISSEIQKTQDDYIERLSTDPQSADFLLQSILDLQTAQKIFLKALKWEQKGELDVSKLPKQVQNLVK